MHARTIEAKLVPGKADEALRVFEEQVLPLARQQPGYVSASLLLDRENNTAITLSIWESEEAEEATSMSSSYLKGAVSKLSAFLVNRKVSSWEVAADDRA